MTLASLAVAPEERPEISWLWDVCRTLGNGLSAVHVRAESSDQEKRRTTFVASTETPDRAMDVIEQKSWNLKPFREHGPVLDNHDPMRVCGVGVRAVVEDVGLVIEVEWDTDSLDPSIANVGHQHLRNPPIRKAGSVGFRPGKRTKRSDLPKSHQFYQEPIEVDTWWGGKEVVSGWLFQKCELLEFSSATVPMNPEALQRNYLAELGIREPGAERDGSDLLLRAALSDQQRSALVAELFPDLLALMRTAPEYRRLLRALVEMGPPKSLEPSFFEQVALLVSKEK